MQEAKETAKRKIKQIEMEKREAARRNSAGSKGGSSSGGGGGGGYSGIIPSMGGGGGGMRGIDSGSPVSGFVVAPSLHSQQPTAGPAIQTTTRAGKGMKLGGASQKNPLLD